MTIALKASSALNSNGTGSTASITHSLTFSSGDLIVVMINRNNSTTAIDITDEGFTELWQADGAESSRYAIGYKISNGTESDPLTFGLNVSASHELHMLAFTGTFSAGTVEDVLGSVDTATPPITGETVATASVAIAFVQADTGGTEYTGADSPWTLGTGSQSTRNAASAYQLMPSGGATTDCTFQAAAGLVDHGLIFSFKEGGGATEEHFLTLLGVGQ